ncbi:hypothetical protein BH18ACT8_BH18ACT8_09610 [soil metagenome]
MHVPDGFIDAPTSLAAGAVAVMGVGLCLRGARRELNERTAPLAGLVAAFFFAAQMLNFPVASGTSGHLLGGVLAAILVGPFTGALAVTTVLLVQALLFADGGLTALGVNIVTMAFVTVAFGYPFFRLLAWAMPRRRDLLPVTAAVAALVSVPVASLVFVGFYSVGGTVDLSVSSVAAAMVGVHLFIGIGEAVITGLTVASVITVRPDLVYGARGLLPRAQLELRIPTPSTAASGGQP